MNHLNQARYCRSRGLVILFPLLLLMGSLLLTASSAAAAPRAQLQLLALAAQNPDATVRVIVQKTAPAAPVESLVTQLGGTILQNLHIINGFVAELEAKHVPALARGAGVRWVSLDSAVKQSTVVVSTAWASGLGSALTNSWTDTALAVDSAFGPNGTFAYGGNNMKGAFGGIAVEDTPGNAITKVEAILFTYVPSALGHDLKLQIYLGGNKIKDFPVSRSVVNSHVGAANAGAVYIDITNARAWKWAEFDNQFELALDLGPFDRKDFIYLDAIGVRVTSDAGTDQSLNGFPTSLPKAAIDTSKLVNIYDGIVRAPSVWNESPGYLQGQGMTVAVVDSGITKHYDIGSRLIAKVNFNKAYHDSVDRYGHGTVVASIIGGDGKKSGGQYIGIAPKTNLVNVRISDDQGMATEADVINALQWVLENKTKYNIRVVNLSLNSSLAQSYDTSPMDVAAEILWFNGIVVVVSVGNNGSETLYPPANDPFVITVGATDPNGTLDLSDDLVASFSAYGTTESGAVKPELVAPGKDVVAYLPENDKVTVGKVHPNNRVNKDFFRVSGSSAAAPMVSGAVALLLQSNPELNPDQVKYRLMATANRDWPGYDATKAGAGYLDIYAAIHETTTETANTGLRVSNLLTTGPNGVLSGSANWASANWASANWGSVDWGSANWGSANWGSANWGSDYWER